MVRQPRVEFPGAVYHVVSRGIAGTAILSADGDRGLFLSLLGSVGGRSGWLCHAYCLMDTHYDLLVETPAPNLSGGLHRLNGVYAQTYNRLRNRTGHVFEARFHAVLVEKESHLLQVARYIVLNPVRARICEDPASWPWSSYRATAGLELPPSFLTIDWLLGQLATVRPEAQERYRAFVTDGMGPRGWQPPRGRVVGRPEFVRRFVHPGGHPGGHLGGLAPGPGPGARPR